MKIYVVNISDTRTGRTSRFFANQSVRDEREKEIQPHQEFSAAPATQADMQAEIDRLAKRYGSEPYDYLGQPNDWDPEGYKRGADNITLMIDQFRKCMASIKTTIPEHE